MSLSVCLATYNEENNIADCLDSVKKLADEIVVVDSNSSDHTAEIARSFGAKVISSENFPIFHIQKQVAVDKATKDWVLVLDADERVPEDLAKEISEVLRKNPDQNGFWIKRRKKFLGQWIRYGGQYPDPVIRLFRRGKGHHPQKSVHEQIAIDGKVGWLKNELIHLPTPSFSTYISKDNRYSSLFADELMEKDPGTGKLSFIRFFLFPWISTFLSQYFRHRGFMDGFPGFVFAFYSGLTRASAYVKYWEAKVGGSKDLKNLGPD